jgi:hypothetical protein
MLRIAMTFGLLLACAARLTAGPYDDLLKIVPPDTNTLVLVNVKGAYASPLGRGEKWFENYFQRYRAGVGFVPPEAEAVVVASNVNLSSLTRDHEVGLVKLKNSVNIRDLAARSGGTTDRIADQVVALTPEDVYFIGLPKYTLAGVYPANRQAATRWVKHALGGKPTELSPYLKKAAESAGDDAVTVAVDLSDSFDPALLKAGLPSSPAVVRQGKVNVDLVSKFIATAQGMTVSIKVHEGITASVRVDFGLEVAPYKRIARELFLELLDYEGAAIPGMSGWETTYGEKSMTLSGSLTKPDLRRVLSLFAFPAPGGEEDPKEKSEAVSVPATKRYLGALDVILDDLRKLKDTPDYKKMATWNEKAAEQIDQLSRRAVDPVAVTAAQDAAKRLRAVAGSLRGVPINLDSLASQAYVYGTTNTGWSVSWRRVRPVWTGGGGVSTNVPQIVAEQQKVIDGDRQRRTEVWIQIDELLADARKKLEDKHKTRF